MGIRDILPGILLVYSSWTDIRRREISGIALILFGGMGLLCTIFGARVSFLELGGGVMLGCCMIMLSILSGGELGMGDSLLVLVIALYMGGTAAVEILLGGMALAAVFSMGLMVIRGFGKRIEFPFVPFLLCAFVLRIGAAAAL